MIRTGLVSVSFRNKQPAEIVEMVSRAGLQGIEWGGDIHVPHGDLETARKVARLTADEGLNVAAYGSYYRVAEIDQPAFTSVVDAAAELGAPTIRVWAGNLASAAAESKYRLRVVEETRRIADLAHSAGKTVSFEFHGGTLTDTNESARALLEQVAHPAVRCYWQPPVGQDMAYCMAGLVLVQDWLSNVHVYEWGADHTRFPLGDGADRWREYLHTAAGINGERYALLEFVKDDSAEQFLADAVTLRSWIHDLES